MQSNYAMCAVSSSRTSPSFSDEALREVVVATMTSLYEIANYNVDVNRLRTIAYCIAFYVLTLPFRANNTSVLESLFSPDNVQRPELHQGLED